MNKIDEKFSPRLSVNCSFRLNSASNLLMIMWNDDEKVNPLMFSEI